MLNVNLDYISPPEIYPESSYVYETNNNTNNYRDIQLTPLRWSDNIQQETPTNNNSLDTTTSAAIIDVNISDKKTADPTTQFIQDNCDDFNQPSTIITNQPKSNNHNADNNQQTDAITSQPIATAPKNINDYILLGILKNTIAMPFINKKISLINLSKNHVAFNQKLLCCHPLLSCNDGHLREYHLTELLKLLLCCNSKLLDKNSSCLPVNQLTLVNIDDYNEFTYSSCSNIPAFLKKNNLPVKEISFDENNKQFAILYDSNNINKSNSELYLAKQIENLDETTPLKKTSFVDEIKLNCPLQKIHSIYYTNHKLYVIGQQKNQLILMFASINDSEKDSEKTDGYLWKKITTLSSEKFDGSAKFSSNGCFIFLLSNNNQLLVFSKEKDDWSQINKITNISSFPIDINYNSERMIFIENGKLIIRNLKSDQIHTFMTNDITAACFIPNSEDFLMFTSEPKIYLVKQSTEDKNKYYTAANATNQYVVTKVYFHPTELNKLIVLANTPYSAIDQFLISCYLVANIVAAPPTLTCLGTCVKFTFFNGCVNACPDPYDFNSPPPFCCCCSSEASEAYKYNASIGGIVGAGLSAFVGALYCISCGLWANTSQTQLIDLTDTTKQK